MDPLCRECPNCNRWHSAAVPRCDCGFDLASLPSLAPKTPIRVPYTLALFGAGTLWSIILFHGRYVFPPMSVFASWIIAFLATGWILKRWVHRSFGWRWLALPLACLVIGSIIFGFTTAAVVLVFSPPGTVAAPERLPALSVLFLAVALVYCVFTYPAAFVTVWLLRRHTAPRPE